MLFRVFWAFILLHVTVRTKATLSPPFNEQAVLKTLLQNWTGLPIDWKVSDLGNACNWTGVSCQKFGQIYSLDLCNLAIFGALLPSLANLTELQGLLLSNNYIYGNIPPQLLKLDSLAHLMLGNNALSGSLPDSFEGNSYGSLDLENNKIQGCLPHSFKSVRFVPKIGTGCLLQNNYFDCQPDKVSDCISTNLPRGCKSPCSSQNQSMNNAGYVTITIAGFFGGVLVGAVVIYTFIKSKTTPTKIHRSGAVYQKIEDISVAKP